MHPADGRAGRQIVGVARRSTLSDVSGYLDAASAEPLHPAARAVLADPEAYAAEVREAEREAAVLLDLAAPGAGHRIRYVDRC